MLNIDQLIVEFNKGLRTLFAPAQSLRTVPGNELAESEMSVQEKNLSGKLLRVNHSGEICAQALYQGQALTARDPTTQEILNQAASEETEHLAWTEQRISELGARKSLFNPLWYFGSFALGATAGALGNKWNLGFLAETERQVEQHLATHLERLPATDNKSRAILEQMKVDESQHATTALDHGGAPLPFPVRLAMKLSSGIMTRVAFWI